MPQTQPQNETTKIDDQIDAKAHEILRRVFGLQSFRGFQLDVIRTLAQGRDALVLMPTGGGKSLCYQISALMREGMGVVISPLIALMADQVGALEELGVRAQVLNSTLSREKNFEVCRDITLGRVDLLYIAPERLVQPETIELLKRTQISLFAIDEAHCVSTWGHDFRPEYGALSILRDIWPDVPRVALTATADINTREEICEFLLSDPVRFVASFDRPNIRYRVVERKGRKGDLDDLLDFIETEHSGESGIVYCMARATTEMVADFLVSKGVNALAYHAGMEKDERARRQKIFQQSDGVVMVATIAFGMGIDKPDVRFVAHVNMPKSIENYFQETGRAGRDGLPADAWMAYGLQDVVFQNRMIDQSDADDTYKRRSLAKLNSMLALCETVGCRRRVILNYFGEESQECGNCDNCMEPPVVVDMTEAAQKLVSCIWRCKKASGFSFGAGHIIGVLRGDKTEKILLRGHDKLSTYGIGANLSIYEWKRLLRQLVVQGLVRVDCDHMNALELGNIRPLLKGETKIFSRREGARMRRTKVKSTQDLGVDDERLFQRLRGWRRQEAAEQDRAPYMIFPDSTLRALAVHRPTTLGLMANVPGIGERKLEHYGEAVIGIIKQFQEEE